MVRPLVLVVVLALAAAATAAATLYPNAVPAVPVQPVMPVDPAYSYSEWEVIMAAQAPQPERCDGCKPGTEPQPAEAGRASGPDSRIIGGAVAAAGQFPWQAQVRMDNSYFCGGSLINPEWILSAGHCGSGFSSFLIVLGSLYSATTQADPNRLTFSTREAYVHSGYNAWLISDDISVIKLPNKIDNLSDYIRPIRLPSLSQADDSFAGEPAVLSGWGRYGTTSVSPSISPVLRFVDLVVISNQECARSFGSAIRSTNICSFGGSGGPVGACNGDSGGPLTIKEKDNAVTQVGIVSFGTSLGCNRKYPSAYTRVTAYLKWIGDKTGIAVRQ